MPALFSKLVQAPNVFPPIFAIFKRHGHARIMTRTANQTTWKRIKDYVHFYLLLGVLTWGGFAIVVNSLYGPCQLQDTTEDYEPRYWEYEKSPIQQLLQHYLWPNSMMLYETRLSQLARYMQHQAWIREEKRAQRLMFERQDYRAWYYVPYSAKWIEWSSLHYDKLRSHPEWLPSVPHG